MMESDSNSKPPVLSTLLSDLIKKLLKCQRESGEFETHVRTRDGHSFYIGPSPFLSAQVLYILQPISHPIIEKIKQKGLQFLLNIDDSGLGLYKFWYKNPTGTDYPHLPVDMDDTAVVNLTLHLYKKVVIDSKILKNNTNNNGQYYTWLKPSITHFLNHPTIICQYLQYLKANKIFSIQNGKPPMASYHDTEIIARFNIHALLYAIDSEYKGIEKHIPLLPEEITKEMALALHYLNPTNYYLALAKYIKHSGQQNQNEIKTLFTQELRNTLGRWGIHNDIILYYSLFLLDALSDQEISEMIQRYIHQIDEEPFYEICVGNKNFDDYHSYEGKAISLAILILLVYSLSTNNNHEQHTY